MTQPEDAATERPEPPEIDRGGRPEDDDHDLLTFGEAGARLREEIAAQQERLAGLDPDDPAREAQQRRLDLLVDAARRNSRQPITDANFEAFFGYRGTARRNTG